MLLYWWILIIGLMVSKLDKQTCTSEFESHHTALCQIQSKKASKLLYLKPFKHTKNTCLSYEISHIILLLKSTLKRHRRSFDYGHKFLKLKKKNEKQRNRKSVSVNRIKDVNNSRKSTNKPLKIIRE